MKKIVRNRLRPWIVDSNYFACKSSKKTFSKLLKYKDSKIRILDIGCGEKIFESIFPNAEYIGVDNDKNNKKADIVCDASKLPFKDAYFDIIIGSEVLEHVYEIDKTISEIKRVCKKKGYIYISTPFFFPKHSYHSDFYRYTDLFYKKRFKEFKFIEMNKSNSSWSTPILLNNASLAQLNIPFCEPIWGINNILALIMEGLSKIFFHILKVAGKEKQVKFILESMPIGMSVLLQKK